MYEDQIGVLLVATNRKAEGIPHLQKATELDPKLSVAWFHLGVAHCLDQATSSCIANLQKAVSLAPVNAEYSFRLGSACNVAGRF